MIKKIINYVPEIQSNGYLKVENFVSEADALSLEAATTNAFKKARKKYFHLETDFVKVLSITEDLSNKVRCFKYLNEIFNNNNLNLNFDKQ